MKIKLMLMILVVFPFLVNAKGASKTYQGIPTVIDGDTIDIGGDRFRLFGIDAFESKQICLDADNKKYLCGNKAANYLDQVISGRNVTCKKKSMSWNRVVAVCTLGNMDLAQELVRAGWALAWSKYSRRYLSDMNNAKSINAGAWSGYFEAPWDFRKKKRKT